MIVLNKERSPIMLTADAVFNYILAVAFTGCIWKILPWLVLGFYRTAKEILIENGWINEK